jgi:hypothetical protein
MAGLGGQIAQRKTLPVNGMPRTWSVPPTRWGIPGFEKPAHHLLDAQQAGWPDHLPHEARQALASPRPRWTSLKSPAPITRRSRRATRPT